jgi:hypothetical protein
MRISEIINEDMSAEEQLGSQATLSANLLPVLMFLKKRSEDKGLSPKLRTDSLIQLVQNAGDTTFSYGDLVAAHESDDAVKEIIGSFNEDEITLKSDSDEAEQGGDHEGEGREKDPTEVVHGMAKKASQNRE